MQYLLPCTACGRTLPIDLGQAGQRVPCACGKLVEVPTLRGIKALAPAKAADGAMEKARGPQPAAWSPLQGALFSIGILVAVIAGMAAGYCGYAVAQIEVREPTAAQFAEADEHFDSIPLDKMYEIYSEARAHGLGSPQPPAYVQAKRVEDAFVRYTIVASTIAGAGVLMALSSFFIRGH
jgi:hypothetical protein